ncbi:recombinase family protein [Streptomyces laculatispora]|uniref:Recombinase family protein n=1 Tax=Streptomyces laculatispora TaxID=887464 RepID=A0ABY9HZ37_9ACTN|nr:recombinase family protein [Streptomyces laculatispora]WLQ39566.1 recombinase family protein [Streptomyces laculatispora]
MSTIVTTAPLRLRPVEERSATVGRRKRGLIHVRVSKARDDMISPELQVGHALTLARSENIDVIADPIMDLGESGRGFEERRIGEIRQMARDKQFDVLILWIWSGFGRNLRESLQHLDALMDYGGGRSPSRQRGLRRQDDHRPLRHRPDAEHRRAGVEPEG